MTYLENISVFGGLVLGIILLPGADMIYVLANSLTKGREAGLAATMGLIVGGLAHSLYGALGAGFLTKIVPPLLPPLALVGSLYVAWIGLTLVRSSMTFGLVPRSDARSNWEAFSRGVITCLLNPKAYLFMLAIYPQFLKPEFGPLFPQAVLMAMILLVTQLIVYGGLALAAGQFNRLARSSAVTVWMGRVCGMLLIFVAAFTLWNMEAVQQAVQ